MLALSPASLFVPMLGRNAAVAGVLFLIQAEVRVYLASDEAAHWVRRRDGTALLSWVCRPTLRQRVLWRVWPSALPRDRKLASRVG